MKKVYLLSAAALLGLTSTAVKPITSQLKGQTPAVAEADAVPQTPTDSAVTVQYSPNLNHVQALMFYAINNLRQQNRLQPLQYNQNITNAWSQNIVDRNANQNSLSHDMAGESQAFHSIGYTFFGENLAMTPVNTPIRSGNNILDPITSDEQLAIALVTQYYDDVGVADFGHRKNLLNPYFTQMGMAFAQRTGADGVTRVYNSLDFAGVSSPATNHLINTYVAYSSQAGTSNAYPSTYTPLSPKYINWQSGIYGVVTRDSGLELWDGYGDNRHYSGRTLADGSAWKIDATKVDNHGNLWYLVGPNQWIDSHYVTVYA